MASKKKKNKDENKKPEINAPGHIIGSGEIVNQLITETLEVNYMPYAMSVIVSRAIPEIDGFKPSHRKILYTMYKMGLLTGPKSKSANIVGRTMQLNPHGDAAIYETMVRLSKGYEALIHPYVESKGNFGKSYSRDMLWAAARYTEAKLDPICNELFCDIDKDTVDFVDNYDGTLKEPRLLPVTFPSILVNATTGIAVGMASSICSFNLGEVCDTAMALVKNPGHDLFETLKAPDFAGGGQILYDREAFENIYETGRGGFKVRAKYIVDASNNCIDIIEIPPTTTVEVIIDKIIERVKAGTIKEISDIRDETDRNGLKITIDIKRGVDPDKLMLKLFRLSTLEDTFSCNFNVLVEGTPKVYGIRELLAEWTAFRTMSIRRRVHYELRKAKYKLHLLEGLAKILLDIDKAIRIVRNTQEESEVVPNLMVGFMIDEKQAEFVAEIKLRHLNREYILKRTQDIEKLKTDITDMEAILSSKDRVKKIIIDELAAVKSAYAKPRKSEIVYSADTTAQTDEEEIPDYPVNLFFTREGYFKKITPLSLRMGGEHKLKDGDSILIAAESTNRTELLFFTDRHQVYKAKASDFEDTKASVLGDYVPSKLEMDPGESAVYMAVINQYTGYMMFFFANGKAAKVDISAYETKTNRKKLIKAYCDRSPLAAAQYIEKDCELVMISSAGRMLLIDTGAIAPKSTKDTLGVSVMTLKKGHSVVGVREYKRGEFAKPFRYKTKNLPAAGALPSADDMPQQLEIEGI